MFQFIKSGCGRLARWVRCIALTLAGFPRILKKVFILALKVRYDLTAQIQEHPEHAFRLARSQLGAINAGWLEGIFVSIILLVVLVTFMWQQGLPMLIESTSNTTALEDAGATAAQVNWVVFIGGAIVIFCLIGVLIVGLRVALGGRGGGGGGGRKWFRRRKR